MSKVWGDAHYGTTYGEKVLEQSGGEYRGDAGYAHQGGVSWGKEAQRNYVSKGGVYMVQYGTA